MDLARQTAYANGLVRLISHETVAVEKTDNSKFYAFRELLKKEFPNLFATLELIDFDGSTLLKWKGQGESLPVMFMNHADVVEANGKWKHGAFNGVVEDGKVWGRGALDTKGGLYCMLQATEELVSEGFVPKGDIYLESSCNEETDGSGALAISNYLKEQGVKFSYILDEGGMIVSEPIPNAKGDFAMIGVGEKGIATIKFVATSQGGHGATPFRNSPLVRLGRVISKVDKSKIFKVEMSDTFCKMFKVIAKDMKGFSGFALRHPKFFKPILKRLIPKMSDMAGAMMKTTVAFTMANGAKSDNVIPVKATVTADVRVAHHQGFDQSVKALTDLASRYDVGVEVVFKSVESRLCDYNNLEFKHVENAVKQIFGDISVCPYVMTGASDLRFMSDLSENCYRFTPFKVNDKQLKSIHGKDENVDVTCLGPAVDFYKLLMKGV